ncbi:MAG: hypothetical protein HC855_06495 [Rhizobiales bacterium]|nr:hypothetical protein [Hyphomicrobiales bacterium]
MKNPDKKTEEIRELLRNFEDRAKSIFVKYQKDERKEALLILISKLCDLYFAARKFDET